MGISVKKTDSPIGYFGTGLKFALATLLRTGHTVRLWTGCQWHSFGLQDRTVRGEVFSIVTMDGEALPFASTLGKDWVPWQAYRELVSNARDEPDAVITTDRIDPEAHGTCWVVDGNGIETAHRLRSTIFCDGRVIFSLPGIAEVREGSSPYLFYRGVRVHEFGTRASQYTYNLLEPVDLTEDRTLKYSWVAPSIIGRAIARGCEDVEVLDSILMAQQGEFEHSISFDSVDRPSPIFLERVAALAHNAGIHRGAHRLWVRSTPSTDVYDTAILDDEDRRMVDEAEELCLAIDPDYLLEARYVVSLGDMVYGSVRGDDVMISHSAITLGVDFLAATLYEEYLHKQHGMADESRSMQNHLFQQLVRLARRLP
jgi:hypothetical protein